MTIRIYNSRDPKFRKRVSTYRYDDGDLGMQSGVHIAYGEYDRNHNYHCQEIVKKNFKGGKDE